jgi:tetratricopeptide (TPR) repeat protein
MVRGDATVVGMGYDPAGCSAIDDMVRFLASLLSLAVLSLVFSARAWGQSVEIRVAGEHRAVAGDTPELAKALARADARQKAAHAAVARLGEVAGVRALGLKPGELEAFTAVLVRTGERTAAEVAGTRDLHRVQVEAVLDDRAVRRLKDLHNDQDAAFELVQLWTGTERLSRRLADLTRARTSAPRRETAAIAREQMTIVTAIEVKALTAQAYAACARTVFATIGGRVSSPEGCERAKTLAQAALALAPDTPDVHVLVGDLLVEFDQPAEAEVEYRVALESAPGSSSGRRKLAAAMRLQNRLPEALDEVQAALTIDPASARGHADLGMILRAQKKLPEAIAAYHEAIRIDPDLFDARNDLGVTLATSGKPEEASAQFREVIRIDPDSPVGYYNLGNVLADLDRDAESAAALREVIRINPNHYNAHYNLGELFRLEQKYDDSATQFREYLRLAPPDTPQNQRNIARATRLIRQFEDPNAPPEPQPRMPPR